jgi:hypothetical protein
MKVLSQYDIQEVNGGSCSSCEAAGAKVAQAVKAFNKAVSGAPIR